MKSKAFVAVATAIIALVLLTGACSAGFVAGTLLPRNGSQVSVQMPDLPGSSGGTSGSDSNATPQDLEELFAPFWQTWDLVHDQYVDQPVDDEALMRGAISGMLEALGDTHTSYMDPVQYEQFNEQLNGGEYEGIGAFVDTRGEYVEIIRPIPGSPAEKAGLQPGDEVIAIDGEDMTGLDGELVRQKILGPKGSTLVLTIRREGVEEPIDVTLQRASIILPTIENRMLENNIAYIRLYTFGDDTADDLRSALEELLAQQPSALILDLRNNPGGYLNTGIAVASEFIKEGVVMYEEFGDGRKETFEANGLGMATEIPVVVLINEVSASASEIVAGAIRDRGRGQLVGMTSFGKGSVQIITDLENNQGMARVTTARWLTPNGDTIDEVGLEPDVKVELTEEDITAGRDPQLEKAIELLTQP